MSNQSIVAAAIAFSITATAVFLYRQQNARLPQQHPPAEEYSSASATEVENFKKQASKWWSKEDGHGSQPYSLLLKMNPSRIEFILKQLRSQGTEISQKTVLDIGCGGGFLSVALAQLGATVLGVDAVAENIKAADEYLDSLQDSLRSKVTYLHGTAESLILDDSKSFDLIMALEIIEHVTSPQLFIQSLRKLLNPEGILFISTINRTVIAYLSTIIGAEYILGWIPLGSHQYVKYVTPQETKRWCEDSGMEWLAVEGMLLNPITLQWSLSEHITSINYICAVKLNQDVLKKAE